MFHFLVEDHEMQPGKCTTFFLSNKEAVLDMQEDLLHPERLKTLEQIMGLYGRHIDVGDEIRVGVEGDPCSRYRAIDEAPSARVDKIIERHDDGFVRFRATLERSGESVEFTNRSYDPSGVWEIHPSYIERFSDRVTGGGTSAYRSTESEHTKAIQQLSDRLSSFTADVSERIAALEETHERYRGGSDSDQAFRETMASTIRALAGDTLRIARGEPVEFAYEYVNRYDMALEDRASTQYRGGAQKIESDEDEVTDEEDSP